MQNRYGLSKANAGHRADCLGKGIYKFIANNHKRY